MCGICGVLHFKNHERGKRIVGRMLEHLKHRGPDVQSLKKIDMITLGHTRLKIIDTSSASDQPFYDAGAEQALVYNGECYNFEQIREDLRAEYGLPFRTSGDTEVLFKLFQTYGPRGLEKINGMFAFAFWDSGNQQLQLARDRLGIKPLYYVKSEEAFYFASEFRALADVLETRSMDRSMIAEYLTYQSTIGEKTLHPHIKKLLPGMCLSIQANGDMKVSRYYNLKNAVDQQDRRAYRKADLKRAFFRSVKRRLVSDVPLGAFLSGGIDSTAVVAAMHELKISPLKTFTLGFEDKNLDERHYAKTVAQKFNTDHTEVILSGAEVLKWVKEGVANLDQPSGDAINTYLVSKYTRVAGLTVALSGLGGDELFAGYPSARVVHILKQFNWLFRIPRKFREFMLRHISISDRIKQQKMRAIISGGGSVSEIVKTLRTVFNHRQLKDLGLQQEVIEFSDKFAHPLNAELYYELMYYTIPLLLKDTDQTGMAHALEIRVPFLDHEFVEYCARYPGDLRNPRRASYPKFALIDALSPLIPDEVYNRPKKGFVLPMEQWIKNELKSFTEAGLFDSPVREWLNADVVEQYWQQFIKEDESQITWSRIWSISVLGHWMMNTGLKA